MSTVCTIAVFQDQIELYMQRLIIIVELNDKENVICMNQNEEIAKIAKDVNDSLMQIKEHLHVISDESKKVKHQLGLKRKLNNCPKVADGKYPNNEINCTHSHFDQLRESYQILQCSLQLSETIVHFLESS